MNRKTPALPRIIPGPATKPEANVTRISRRTALRQFALGGAGLALGIKQAGADLCVSTSLPPVLNNNLGAVVELNQGNWHTVCIECSGANCTGPIWKDINGASPALGFLNDNYAGNSVAFASQGGFSDMFVLDLPWNAGRIYRITWVAQIANSGSDLDEMQFIISGGGFPAPTIVDKMYRTSGPSGRSERSVLFVPNGDPVKLTWRAIKAVGANTGFRFRVDNLRIVQLPDPVLAVFPYDATRVVVWWDKIYGRDQNGTVLLTTTSLENPVWVPADAYTSGSYTITNELGDTIGYGLAMPMGPPLGSFRPISYFKLNVTGTPPAP